MNPMLVPQIDPLQAYAQLAQGGMPSQQQPEVADPLQRMLEYAQQKQAQIGPAPQADPSVMADMDRGQRERMMAEALLGQGYVPNSGALGAVAQVLSAYMGTKRDRKAGETIADALKRDMEYQSQAAQYEGQRKAFEEGPARIIQRTEQARALGLEGDEARQFVISGKLPEKATPKGYQMSGGFLLNKDTGDVSQVEGYEASRARIAAAGAGGGQGGGFSVLSAEEAAQLGLPAGTVAQRDPKGKISVVSAAPRAAAETPQTKEQVAASGMAQDALAFAAALTGKTLDEIATMSPADIRDEVKNNSRFLSGPLMGRIPFAAQDLEAYANAAAGKQARLNNPTGPVSNSDFEVARKSVFSPDKPASVNADLIYQALTRGGTESPAQEAPASAPVEGARKAPDGKWYVERNGQYFEVQP